MKTKILMSPPDPGCLYEIECDELSLEFMQTVVGGYIEACAPAELRARGYEMLVDEEGLLKGLPVNENLLPFFHVGNAVFVKVEGEEFVGLSDEDIDFIRNWLLRLE